MGAAAGPGRGLEVAVVGPTPRVRAAAGLGAWLARAAPRGARGEVTVALVSDAQVRRLNAAFRRVDAVTDVLSFSAFAEARDARAAAKAEFLGDVAIALGVARRQAIAHGHSLAVELRLLALHGLLHLLGYDHEADAGEMRRVEERLRRRAGLPAGLTARAGAEPARRRQARRGALKR